MADKQKQDSGKKESSEAKDSSKELKLRINLKKLNVNAQTILFTLGMALPFGLVWLGTYLMFTFPALLVQVQTYLKNFTPDKTPALYEKVLLPMMANSNLMYFVVGIVMYIVAVILARGIATRYKLTELKVGDIRLRSVVMAALVAFIVAAVVISLANQVLFDPLLALQTA